MQLYNEVIFYKTQQNDRWDKIAYKFYGDVFKIQPIVQANPNIQLTPVIPAGLTLIIPIITTTSDVEGLPIWKK